jgi:hypothetical protein
MVDFAAFRRACFEVVQNADGTVTVTGYLNEKIKDVVIPAAIGSGTFSDNQRLDNVRGADIYRATIPSDSFTNVTLPANIDDINLRLWDEGLVNFYKSQGKKAGT